ncbi:MAG: hypothetical protein QF902_01090 [Rhodospirillales bacterium]|nr:hypothetical protein [Rhodospirillales bacterium]
MRRSFPLIIALALSACAYTGAEDPISRKLSWYSYLDAADIRASCAPGAPARYRFVYNAIYVEQVRAYDVTEVPGSGRHPMRVRVFGPAIIATIRLAEPQDVLAPWWGEAETAWLDDDDLARIDEAIAADGAFSGAPTGLRLHSDGFYWIVAACRDGRFGFSAYRWPDPRFERARFPELLFVWDPVSVPVNAPRAAEALEIHGGTERDDDFQFEVEVGERGLVGPASLF